jgi:hypothetical protein
MTAFDRGTVAPDGQRTARRPRVPRLALALAALAAASGCALKTDVAATGAAAANVTHLWVTVNEVWLATGADTPPESTSGWSKHVLASPLSFDLATLGNGTLQQLLSQVSTAAGTYQQVHLVLAEPGDALTSSAQAAGLTSNAQITVSNASGAITTAPLESAVPRSGLTIATNLKLSGSLNLGNPGGTTAASGSSTASPTPSTATIALAIDGARDVLPYSYGTSTGYILSAITSATDEADAGAISGTVDATALAAGAGPVSVSAEIADPTNSHHVIVQRRAVGSGGAFTLYPLPAPRSGTTSYDLVIAGAGAETMIVRGIPVRSGSAQSPVVAQSAPFVLAAAPTVYANLAPQSTALPGGARVAFYQTVPAGGEIPYAIDASAIDLLSRRLPGDAFALGAGPMQVGNYASGGAVAFATLAPLEGDGGFVVGSEGRYRTDTLLTAPTLVSGTSTAPTPIVAPYPAIAAGGSAGTLSVTLQTTAGRYDSGFVVVAAGSRVVDAAPVGTLLASGGGTITVANVPGGGALAASAGVPYQVAVRAWNSNNATASLVRVATSTSTVLGAAVSGSVTLQLP